MLSEKHGADGGEKHGVGNGGGGERRDGKVETNTGEGGREEREGGGDLGLKSIISERNFPLALSLRR